MNVAVRQLTVRDNSPCTLYPCSSDIHDQMKSYTSMNLYASTVYRRLMLPVVTLLSKLNKIMQSPELRCPLQGLHTGCRHILHGYRCCAPTIHPFKHCQVIVKQEGCTHNWMQFAQQAFIIISLRQGWNCKPWQLIRSNTPPTLGG